MKEDALREGRRAVETEPESLDAFQGTDSAANLALVYALIGEQDQAITLIERLLSIPGLVSTPPCPSTMTLADLRLRWEWDSLPQQSAFPENPRRTRASHLRTLRSESPLWKAAAGTLSCRLRMAPTIRSQPRTVSRALWCTFMCGLVLKRWMFSHRSLCQMPPRMNNLLIHHTWCAPNPWRRVCSSGTRAPLPRLFQPTLVELDEVEIGANIFPADAAGLPQEVDEARSFLGGVRPS
jgi:hypothetical protein